MQYLYTFGIHLYVLAVRIAALFNDKARKWVDGRKDWQAKLREATTNWAPGQAVWIHCASLGEFEQARPILEELAAHKPQWPVLLTFFSPSGYEIRSNYEFADHVCYLPADTPSNVRTFLDIVQPRLHVSVKYEFWYNYLDGLQKRKIQHIIISALFRPGQPFFRWYGGWFLKKIKGFTHIFTQNQDAREQLARHGIQQVTVAGDTRIDRVARIPDTTTTYPEIERFLEEQKVLIAGSSWPADEELLAELLQQNFPKNWKLVIAPHDISASHLDKIEARFEEKIVRHSSLLQHPATNSRILLIDNIGMLSSLYQYGTIAYIGGGFGAGIHNTLEPIAFGLPVLFGPKYQKFEEANYLVVSGGGHAIHNRKELALAFQSLLQENAREQSAAAARRYIDDNRGATQRILEFLL